MPWVHVWVLVLAGSVPEGQPCPEPPFSLIDHLLSPHCTDEGLNGTVWRGYFLTDQPLHYTGGDIEAQGAKSPAPIHSDNRRL